MKQGTRNRGSAGRDHLVFNLPKLVVNAGDLSQRVADVYVFAPFKLSTAKYTLLVALSSQETAPTMTELRKRIMKSSSNLTQLIDALEKSGDVRRVADSSDRRAYRIEITTKGRGVLAEVDAFRQDKMREYLKDYSDEELRTMLRLLHRYVADCAGLLGLEGITAPETL
jgi:DNA-binding MarR family transcriptional regulator